MTGLRERRIPEREERNHTLMMPDDEVVRRKAESAMSEAWALKPLRKALGTEVGGVDVAQKLEPATLQWIERAFAEHPVLVFRNQRLEAAELAAFGAQFGRPQPHILEQYRAWRVGDVVMWDEIATMHRGAADARPEERRIMLRTIVHPHEH
jgi:alpha-ketoglutarate-dependent taurine dioxygenase